MRPLLSIISMPVGAASSATRKSSSPLPDDDPSGDEGGSLFTAQCMAGGSVKKNVAP
jgi:hypothetical protein